MYQSVRSAEGTSCLGFEHDASQQHPELWRLRGQMRVTAYSCILQENRVWTLSKCVCTCTLSDLIRLYLWWCLTPLRAWQLLPSLSLSLSVLSILQVSSCLSDFYNCFLFHHHHHHLSLSLSLSICLLLVPSLGGLQWCNTCFLVDLQTGDLNDVRHVFARCAVGLLRSWCSLHWPK